MWLGKFIRSSSNLNKMCTSRECLKVIYVEIFIKFLHCLSVCVPFFTMKTNPYISAKNKDNDTKPSGYDPWGLPRSSRLSKMTLSSKSHVRNPQRPPSTPLLDPLIPDTLLIKISTQNFQGIFLGVKHNS